MCGSRLHSGILRYALLGAMSMRLSVLELYGGGNHTLLKMARRSSWRVFSSVHHVRWYLRRGSVGFSSITSAAGFHGISKCIFRKSQK